MNFVCYCMSPAIDGTIRLPSAPSGDGTIYKDVDETETVGGKGVNVARWLAIRGEFVACAGLLGEDNASLFARELKKYGIGDGFVRVPGSTRKNEMIIWPGGSMKLNRASFAGVERITSDRVGRGLRPRRDTGSCGEPGVLPLPAVTMSEPTVAILSGSLPLCCDSDFYFHLITALKAQGCIVVLDASGKALVEGVKAHPDWIKPNDEECAALIGSVPKTDEEFLRATSELKAFANHVLISAGASGCWVDGSFVAAPKVEHVVDTTAAGDTLLAEFCHRHFGEGLSPCEAARWAVAAGSASVMHPGAEPPMDEEVAKLF